MLTLINRLKSDEALMQAYQRGDTGAFESLYQRHKDGLFTFLYRSCPRPAVVEELAQEAWFGVVRAAPDYRPGAAFRTWLYQIGRNRLADYWRRRDNHHTDLELAPEPVASNAGEAGDLEARLMAAIGALPAEQRDTLLLQEQGFSLSDIAAITGSGVETIKSRLRYARGQLREQLGEDL
jgi:RNA polymerase sigma-70 factor (ECF subfamily)